MRYLLWVLLNLRLYHVLFPARKRLAREYLAGNGIEIGALHLPLKVPRKARVRYVDRKPVEQLRQSYPELGIFRLTPIDIVDNGETLETIMPNSQDFIIANHFIEHCENPVKTLVSQLARLKPGGILFMAVPDKDKTFDKKRPVSPLDHIIGDYQSGPESSRLAHYREWVRSMEKVPEEEADERARQLMDAGYSIHFHVWRKADFQNVLDYVRTELRQPFIVRDTVSNRNEFIVILQKSFERAAA